MESPFKFIRRTPAERAQPSAFVLALPFLAVVVLIILISVASIEALGAVRAYIGGGAQWTRGVKGASYCLARYATSASERDFQCYEEMIATPMHLHDTRLAVARNPPDWDAAAAGMTASGMDEDDVVNTLRFYRLYSLFPQFQGALTVWQRADAQLQTLEATARSLHAEISQGKPDAAKVAALIAQVDLINDQVAPANVQFGTKVGAAAREIATILAVLVTMAGVILGLLAVGFTRLQLRERVRYSAMLQESERRYRDLFKESHDALMLARIDGEILEANRAAEQLLGYSSAELKKLGRAGIIDESSAAWRVAQASRSESGSFRAKLEFRRSDGSFRVCDVSSAPFRSGSGSVLNSVVLRDITEPRPGAAPPDPALGVLQGHPRSQPGTVARQRARAALWRPLSHRRRVWRPVVRSSCLSSA